MTVMRIARWRSCDLPGCDDHARPRLRGVDAHHLTKSLRDAAELAGCSKHTFARDVQAREKAGPTGRPVRRDQLIDPFLAKVEEWVERSHGKVRADRAHAKLVCWDTPVRNGPRAELWPS